MGETIPRQAPLKLIKRCRLHLKRGDWKIPPVTRGIYVLYREGLGRGKNKTYEVFYIGVGGISKNAHTGIGGRVKHHHKSESKRDLWTHYSLFEVHDNVSREEILELESLFLWIFGSDPRIKLANVQLGLKTLKHLSKDSAWPAASRTQRDNASK
jgi:hypothetical protein